jgi:hypothetical protein
MTTQEMIREYLARGGQITVCQPSLAPVCVPIPRGRLSEAELSRAVWLALKSFDSAGQANASPTLQAPHSVHTPW